MASTKALASTSLLLSLNLLLFSLVYSTCSRAPLDKPTPTPKPKPHHKLCPHDTLKLGLCSNLLSGIINLNIGKPPKMPCCSLLEGLADQEAAVCLCTAFKANIRGIQNIPVSLSLLLNYCGKQVPGGYICA